jgi:hypothetical protein
MQEEICQQDLANIIKGTHAYLRLKVQKIVSEVPSSEIESKLIDTWNEHAKIVMSSTQKSYASAMGTLARQVWEQDSSTEDKSQSRIDWIKRHMDKYFLENDRQRFEERLQRKFSRLTDPNSTASSSTISDSIPRSLGDKVRVLDVGSCYNPFAKFSNYQVIAIDLSPAAENVGVYQCDFVNVKIIENLGDEQITFDGKDQKQIESIATISFDAVVFCLLLEYLPLPQLRYRVCYKACRVLKTGGLLIIVTPDSCHQGRNLDQVKQGIHKCTRLL